jgi:hypothetical protein
MMKKIILTAVLSAAVLASSAFAQAKPGLAMLLSNIPSASEAPVVMHVHFAKSLKGKSMADTLKSVLGKSMKVQEVSKRVATYSTAQKVLITCVLSGKNSMSMPGATCSN